MERSAMLKPMDVDRVLKPFALPIGLASPMWLAYGAAASVGATWWWMSRLTRLAAPVPTRFAPEPAPRVEPVEAAAPAWSEPASQAPEPVDIAAVSAPVALDLSVEPQPDELTLLRGVGPRVADALVARGVTTFAQLAAWSETEMSAFDSELKLLGRSKRYDFLAQARELAAAS